MRVGWKRFVAFLVAAPVVAMMMAWAGIVDIRASTGHWRATDWFLHWAMRSSVRTAALSVTPPDLNHPDLLPAAAGHFERGCAICHGSPAARRTPTVRSMLPPPPELASVVERWTDAQLFEIVKHGIRYTGMPAWPSASRDDEVWAMIAFLRRLPGMTAQDYHALSGSVGAGMISTMPAAIAYCDSCHGDEETGGKSLVPDLDGQSATYLLESLKAYFAGKRASGIMQTALGAIDHQLFQDLATHYEAKVKSRPVTPDAFSDGPGEALAQNGSATRKIPACLACHGKSGNPAYPQLGRLSPSYIEAQLRLFSKGERGSTPYQLLMVEASRNLEDEDIRALSVYFGADSAVER
jgi:cytochrome c553